MSIKAILAGAVFAAAGVAAASAQATTLTVDAKDDIFLAGQTSVPTGFPANSGTGGEGAGLLPTVLNVSAGETLSISASGTVSCCLGGSPTNGPDGGGLGGATSINGYGKVGAFSSGTQMALVAVFGGAGLTAPWSVFTVGSSDSGIVVPTGATQLYLGIADANGFSGDPGFYNDNTGAFSVNVAGVPEPATWAVMLVGFGGVGAAMRRRRKLAVA